MAIFGKNTIQQKQSKIFNKRNFIGGFIVLLMITSILGVFQGNTLTTKYNKFKIKQDLTTNKYTVKVDGKKYSFDFHPTSVESIIVAPEIFQRIKQSNMQYLTFNPSDPLINEIEYTRFSMQNSFRDAFSIYLIPGVTNQTEPYTMLPLITCVNATDLINVVEMKQGNETKVYQQNNCIIWEAQDGFSLREIKEKIMYQMLGVMT
ncbi:hypothetical protein HYY69_06210 [Candidatus Woesearchaeota archaeon]|nr:hypothetical protein [Candidatus Woesearchaeota archaeon]